MYLIVGLGNPEGEYSNTRHNMGFDTINKLANQYKIEINRKKFKGLYGSGLIENEKVILLKPQTYMNLSGESIVQVVSFYKIEEQNIIVIYDDMDVQLEHIKIRKSGSAGSHNGMKSVIEQLGTKDFPRIRVGIGKPEDKSKMIEFVIGQLPKEEIEKLDKATTLAKDATVEIVKSGIDKAMSKYN